MAGTSRDAVSAMRLSPPNMTMDVMTNKNTPIYISDCPAL